MSKTKHRDVRLELPRERHPELQLPVCDCVKKWVCLLFFEFADRLRVFSEIRVKNDCCAHMIMFPLDSNASFMIGNA
jgi:hypothetical protein